MVLELLFFSVLCGIFGSNLVAVPEFHYSPEETLVLECDGTQGVKRITLYDHDSGVFKPWHNIDDCAQLRFKDEDLRLTAGEWKMAYTMLFFLCSGEHFICDMLNPTSQNKDSIHINYGKIIDSSYHILKCPREGEFYSDDRRTKQKSAYFNIPIISTADCTYSVVSYDHEITFEHTIALGTLTTDAEGFTSNGNEISVTKPAINSALAQGHRYIFKIAVRNTISFIHAIDACLKNRPNGECIDYQIDARSKANFDLISFPVSEKSIQNDAYVEIRLWKMTFWWVGSFAEFHGSLALKVFYRVNKRILEQYRGKIFRKEVEYDIVDVHVLECEDGDISCDTDGRRNFKLTIYGVADSGDISYFNIQGVKMNSDFDCTPHLSRCTVSALMEKHRHTTLEYRIQGTFLALLMADSDSYTAVFKDSSITAVADE